MKKILIVSFITLFAFVGLRAQTQFNNASFENWDNQTDLPIGWNTVSIDLPLYGTLSFCDISKTTDSHMGTYALQMQPSHLSPLVAGLLQMQYQIDLGNIFVPALLTNATINVSEETLQNVMGLLSGSLDVSSLMNMETLNQLVNLLSDGMPIDIEVGAPKSISGYYKFERLSAGDMFLLASLLVKNTDSTKTITGFGTFTTLSATDSMTAFEMPITQMGDADEMIFIALIANMDTTATEAGVLKLDDLSIKYSSGLTEEINIKTNVYPNPTANTFIIDAANNEDVRIYNSLGVMVKEIRNYTPNSEITIKDKGLYTIKVGDRVEKLIVR